MSRQDKMSVGDSMEATVSTPDDEYAPAHEYEGLEEIVERRGAVIPHTVEQQEKGYGVYVEWQDAPLTVRNVTWSSTAEEAEANLDAYLASVTQSQADAALGRP